MGTTNNEMTSSELEREREGVPKRRSVLATARRGLFYLPLLLAGVLLVLSLPELLGTLVTGWTAEGGAELGIH